VGVRVLDRGNNDGDDKGNGGQKSADCWPALIPTTECVRANGAEGANRQRADGSRSENGVGQGAGFFPEGTRSFIAALA